MGDIRAGRIYDERNEVTRVENSGLVAQLHDRIASLEAENRRLREALTETREALGLTEKLLDEMRYQMGRAADKLEFEPPTNRETKAVARFLRTLITLVLDDICDDTRAALQPSEPMERS